MEKNPFNPITEPASYKWWEEKPKEEEVATTPMWPDVELNLDKSRNILHVSSYVTDKLGDLQYVKHSHMFSKYPHFLDLRHISERMEFEVKKIENLIT